ncbi:MAG: hypothetical protein GXP17_02920 [Gammaproteobacteria bacterium]|nr:hypothetical protein [Gammaproteobacteria bacterium]
MKNLGLAGGMLLLLLTLFSCAPAKESVWIPGWKESAAMQESRAGAAVVVNNNFIYMIAGVDGRNFLRSTEYAPILEDGGIGEWKQGPALIEERGFTEAVVRNGYIYVVGGGNGPNGHNLLRTVERAKINTDGSLAPWRRESSQTVLPRRCTKLSVIGDYLYSFGGFGGALLDSVEYAKINSDGSVGEWTMASESMTLPRYVNSVKAVKGQALVIGGHDQKKGVGISDVEWARPDKNGDIHTWKKTSSLKTGRYGLASAKMGSTIFAIGGLTGLEYLKSIEKTSVLSAGGVSAWQETTPLSVPRATFSAVAHNGYLYVLGGSNRDGYLRSVEFAAINPQGDPGFWGSLEERDGYNARLTMLAESSPALPNQGVVKQILNTEMYSYVEVLSQGTLFWLAGPKVDFPVNTRIHFSKGVKMTNFFSKELQRPFPEVNFVSRIEKAK